MNSDASADVERLVMLDRAHTDAALGLAKHVSNGSHSRFDALAVSATHDALDASLCAFKLRYYPGAARILVTSGHVVVIDADGTAHHLNERQS